jgi:hypothetical protein
LRNLALARSRVVGDGKKRKPMTRKSGPQTLKAILTDIQFWIPATVLAAGIALLVILH